MSFGLLRVRWLCDPSVSLPEITRLKAASSLELNKIGRLPENFTTAFVRHFCSMEFGGYGVGAKIVNNDASNVVNVRLHTPTNTPRVVPISAELEINEWFDIIIIEPDGTTGTGQLELDIVPFSEAVKRG